MRVLGLAAGYAAGAILFSLMASGLAYWGTERVRFHVERMELAQNSYEAHLRLAAHSAQLFQSFSDAAVASFESGAAHRQVLKERITEDFRTIRNAIATEIKLVGEEEIEELDFLEDLEAITERLIGHFERIEAIPLEHDRSAAWRNMLPVFLQQVTTTHAELMAKALEEEQEEVSETRALLAEDIRIIRIAAAFFTVIAISSMLALFRYHRIHVYRPLADLIKGAKAMEAGGLTSKIPETDGYEVSQVAKTLNRMADRIHSRQAQLETKNSTLEQVIAERTAELERLLEEAHIHTTRRHQLLADVSHELRTPLTIITGETTVALRRRNGDADDYREALLRAQQAAQQTAAIVDDLLLISRQESGQSRLKLTATNLVDVVSDAIALSSVPAQLETEQREVSIRVDALRMRQAILALLHNTKACGATDTRIIIKIYPDECEIIVRDNGPGLTETEKESSFERFYRGTRGDNGQQQGYGLGLPVVKAIAEAHGGAVHMEDTPGGGLTVVLKIPREKALKIVS